MTLSETQPDSEMSTVDADISPGIIASHQVKTWSTTASMGPKKGIQKSPSPTAAAIAPTTLPFPAWVVVCEVWMLVDEGCGCSALSVEVPVVVLEVLDADVDLVLVEVVASMVSTNLTSATTGNSVTTADVIPFSAILELILFMSSMGLMSFCMIVTPEESAGKRISYATLTASELP